MTNLLKIPTWANDQSIYAVVMSCCGLHSRKHEHRVPFDHRCVPPEHPALDARRRASAFIVPQRARVPIDWRGSSTPEAEHRRDACRRRRPRPMLRRLRAAKTPPTRKPG